MKIGELARRADCSIQTIRFYEKQGLLPEPNRSEGNFRLYRSDTIEQLAFIRRCRNLGMSLDDIKQLIALSRQPDKRCADIDAIVQSHLTVLTERIAELQALATSLSALAEPCDTDSTVKECHIANSLSRGAQP